MRVQSLSFRLRANSAIGIPAILLCGLLCSAASQSAPFRPTDDGQVLEQLPADRTAGDKTLRTMHQELRRDPENLDLALRTARAYAALGRAEADPRFYGYAQSALAPWWHLDDPPLEVLVLRAVLHQAGHDFDAALHDLESVLQRDPSHGQARLTQALILRARGRISEAVSSCRRLGRRVQPLVAQACLGATESLNGDAARSYRRLRLALKTAKAPQPELRLWVLTLLGEIAAASGEDVSAEQHFRAALALGRRNTYLLAALADLLLDQGRFEEVRGLLAEEAQSDPLLLRLTEAEQQLGSGRAVAHRASLSARFAASRRRGDSRHGREEARFALRVLGQADQALRLARKNWEAQREPADARLLLEAALAANAPKAAKPVLDWLEETDLESAKIDGLISALKKELG